MTATSVPRPRPVLRAGGVLVLLVAGLLPAAGPAAAATTLTPVGAPFATATYPRYVSVATSEAFSSAAVGDVTGDGRPDIVTGSPDGWVRVWATTGALEAAVDTGTGAIQASPTLVDLDGDGVQDVLTANTAGVVAAYAFTGGSTRTVFWRLDCAAGRQCGVFGTPVAADLDGDGHPEIISSSWDHYLYAYRLGPGVNGSILPGWPVFMYDTSWSSPAVGDINGDGSPEVVVGGDCDGVPGQPCAGTPGGYVWALGRDGRVVWRTFVPGQVVWSSPALVDLTGDGRLDVAVGTGLNFPNQYGRAVYALDGPSGRVLWTGPTAGPVMASPAVGDLDRDGRPDLVVLSEGGEVSAWRADGSLLWRSYAADAGRLVAGLPTHGSASVADVDNDGRLEVVVMAEHWMRVLDGATGTVEASTTAPVARPGSIFAPASAPTIAAVDGQTWIVQTATYDANGNGARDVGDQLTVLVWRTGSGLGEAAWPTFHGGMRRLGVRADDVPPTISVPGLPVQGSTAATVQWSSSDVGSGVSRVDVEVQDGAGRFAPWQQAAPPTGSAVLYGQPGASYPVRARATDRAGNVSAWAQTTVTFSPQAARAQPFRSLFTVSGEGTLSGFRTAPVASPAWTWRAVRGVAATPDGRGAYVLDLFGGLHPAGSARPLPTSSYWPGWDIARGVALNPDGQGGYVLDGWGGLHPFGNATPVPASTFWPGWDIARGVVLLPSSTANSPAGYVLDGWGGVHPFGAAPALRISTYWPGWDIARGLTVAPDGRGGQVLDGWGGLHPFGAATGTAIRPYWPGWDIARGVVSVGAADRPAGWVLDGFGGLHAFGGAPDSPPPAYYGRDVAVGLSVAP
ncbi:MAG: FG-GAP-like repeat-containing protein [Actinomycetota bacterium]